MNKHTAVASAVVALGTDGVFTSVAGAHTVGGVRDVGARRLARRALGVHGIECSRSSFHDFVLKMSRENGFG